MEEKDDKPRVTLTQIGENKGTPEERGAIHAELEGWLALADMSDTGLYLVESDLPNDKDHRSVSLTGRHDNDLRGACLIVRVRTSVRATADDEPVTRSWRVRLFLERITLDRYLDLVNASHLTADDVGESNSGAARLMYSIFDAMSGKESFSRSDLEANAQSLCLVTPYRSISALFAALCYVASPYTKRDESFTWLEAFHGAAPILIKMECDRLVNNHPRISIEDFVAGLNEHGRELITLLVTRNAYQGEPISLDGFDKLTPFQRATFIGPALAVGLLKAQPSDVDVTQDQKWLLDAEVALKIYHVLAAFKQMKRHMDGPVTANPKQAVLEMLVGYPQALSLITMERVGRVKVGIELCSVLFMLEKNDPASVIKPFVEEQLRKRELSGWEAGAKADEAWCRACIQYAIKRAEALGLPLLASAQSFKDSLAAQAGAFGLDPDQYLSAVLTILTSGKNG